MPTPYRRIYHRRHQKGTSQSFRKRTRLSRSAVALVGTLTLLGLQACSPEPFPNVVLPVHPEAIQPRTVTDQPAPGAKAVAYRIRELFPAEELISFYDRALARMGFVPFREPVVSMPLRRWTNFDRSTGESVVVNEVPARYMAFWVDRDRDALIWLAITYEYDAADPAWKTKPLVSCNMAKYSSYEKARDLLPNGDLRDE